MGFSDSATNISRADFCIAAASAVSYKFQVNVIGTSRQAQFKRFGPLDKLWALQDFVALIPDHPNVLFAFIDAYGAPLPTCTSSAALPAWWC